MLGARAAVWFGAIIPPLPWVGCRVFGFFDCQLGDMHM